MERTETGSMPRIRRRVMIIFNPVAGRRRRGFLMRVLKALDKYDCEVDLRETNGHGEARVLAEEAVAEGWDVVAAAGGDGTVNEVANGLYGSDLPLAVIPMGTANVLAAEIGLPWRAKEIAHLIAAGEARPVHVGVVNERLFVMMAGVGFDAKVVAAVSSRIKRLIGKAAFVLASVRGIFSFSSRTYRVTVDNRTFTAASAVVANGHYYGGKFTCAPLARLQDPLLYACLFLKPGPLRALRYCTWLVLGRLDRLPDVAILPAVRVTVDGVIGEPVQGDGEILAQSPMTAFLAGHTLRIVMPS